MPQMRPLPLSNRNMAAFADSYNFYPSILHYNSGKEKESSMPKELYLQSLNLPATHLWVDQILTEIL